MAVPQPPRVVEPERSTPILCQPQPQLECRGDAGALWIDGDTRHTWSGFQVDPVDTLLSR